MQRVFFYGLCLSLCLSLWGCGAASSLIKSDTLAFNDVIEDTTNKFLVLNTLRARDKAPLHFADIPLLRESIEQTASLSYLNLLGPRVSTQPRDSLTLGAGIRMSPSFEVNHLQSKDFNTGIVFSMIDIVCNSTPVVRIVPTLEPLSKNPNRAEIIDLFTHEQYFWPFYQNYVPDHFQRLDTAIRWVTEHGYAPVFFHEGLLGGDE